LEVGRSEERSDDRILHITKINNRPLVASLLVSLIAVVASYLHHILSYPAGTGTFVLNVGAMMEFERAYIESEGGWEDVWFVRVEGVRRDGEEKVKRKRKLEEVMGKKGGENKAGAKQQQHTVHYYY